MKQIVCTDQAPAAIGPYSQAVEKKGTLYISGQIPLNPATGEIIGSDIKEQTRQVLNNLLAVVKEAGYSIGDILKTTCYLKDMNTFGEMNEVYKDVFIKDQPARAAVEVSRLPKDVLIEIEAVAMR